MRMTLSLALAAGAVVLTTAGCTSASKADLAGASSSPAGAPTAGSSTPVDRAAVAALPASYQKGGTLTIASDASYPPFEYFAADNKTMIGFDIDLGDALASTLGLKAQHVNAGFDTILAGISSHKYDAGMSAFSVTPERTKNVDFVTYLDGGSGVIVKTGNPLRLKMDPMSLCGHTIGGEKGSIQGLNQLPAISGACVKAGKQRITIQLYPTQTEANLALTSGRVDAVMADSISLSIQAKASHGAYQLAPGADYQPSQTGVALPKGSPLDRSVAMAMKTLVANGTMQQLMGKYGIPLTALKAPLAGQITK